MAYQAVPDGLKIELNQFQNGIPVTNVFYAVSTETIDETYLTDVANGVIAWWNAHASGFDPAMTLANVTVTDVSVADSIQVVVSPTTGGVGTAGGVPAGGNVAAVASLRTGRIGRSFRGRIYFGGVTSSAMDDAQTLGSAAVTFYADLASDLIDALATVNATLVVVSRFAAGVARVVALATEIVTIIVDAKLDSQRRRTSN